MDATDTIQSLSGSGGVEVANGISLTQEIQVMMLFQDNIWSGSLQKLVQEL